MLDRSKKPNIIFENNISVPKTDKTTFSNGIDCYILPSTQEQICRIDLVIKTGKQDHENPLVPVFTSAMLKEGSKDYTANDIAERIDFHGAILVTNTNVSHTVISLIALEKHVNKLLSIVRSIIFYPTFPEDRLKCLLDKGIAQFKTEQQKVNLISNQQLRESIYGKNHPYSSHKELAYYEISSDMLNDFHSKNYCSNNCTIVLSGFVNDSLVKYIEQIFGSEAWNKKNIIEHTWLSETPKTGCIRIHHEGSLQTGISIGQLSAPNNHPDSYSMQILTCVLGGYFGSRLNQSIREEKGYTYGISAHIASYLNKAHFSINTRTKNEVAIETVAAIHDEINNLLQYPVSDEELQTVRNLYITNIGTAFEHPLYISDTLIGLLANNLDFSYYTGFNQVLKTITPNELLNTAQKYWSKPMCEVLVGDFKADK